MVYIAKAFHVASYHMRMIRATIRIPVTLLAVAFFITQNLQTVLQFSKAVSINVTPYAFPHLVNDFVCQLIMMGGVIILFCNAPFEDETYIYMLPRAGCFSWALGQAIYIIWTSFLYTLFLLLLSIFPLIGHMELGTEWGKIWGTLAKTNAGTQFGLMFSVTEYIVTHYSPLRSLIISFFLEWACVSWLGLLIYDINKLTSGSAGTFIGAAFVLFDICIANDWMHWAYRFSPISLAQLNTFTGYNLKYHITLTYSTLFFVVGIIFLVMLCILINSKKHTKGY